MLLGTSLSAAFWKIIGYLSYRISNLSINCAVIGDRENVLGSLMNWKCAQSWDNNSYVW